MYSKDIISKAFSVTKNKSLEIQLTKFSNIFQLGLNLVWRRKGDHPGIYFDIQILPFFFAMNFSDNRHWNYETNTYENYETNINEG
jgi:hypothetical protein